MTQLVEDIFRELMSNDELVNLCINKLKEVFKDNKIDANDIPNVVIVLSVIIEQKKEILNLEYNKKHEILKLFLLHVLSKYHILTSTSTEISPEVETVLDACITLFLHESKNVCTCFSRFKL